jgi:hypothetical protein
VGQVPIAGLLALVLDRDLAQPVVLRQIGPGGVEHEEGATAIGREQRRELAVEQLELALHRGETAIDLAGMSGLEARQRRRHGPGLDRQSSRAGPDMRVARRQVDAGAGVDDLDSSPGGERAKPRRLFEGDADAEEDLGAQGLAHLRVGR